MIKHNCRKTLSEHTISNIRAICCVQSAFSDSFLIPSYAEKLPMADFLYSKIQQISSSGPGSAFCSVIRNLCRILSLICTAMALFLTGGISSACQAPEQLHSAYEKCRAALNTIPALQTSSQYYVWHPDTKNEIQEIRWDKKEEFLFRVEARMTDAVFQLLQDLQDCCRVIPSLTLADVKYHYHQLTEECMLILKHYVSQTNPSQSMHNIVKEIFSPEELHSYYRQFFGNLSEMLKPQSVYAVQNPIEQIQIYTRRNYPKNLTVEFLASLFYMNSSYLSHLFRKRTGVKYVSYLNSIRIEQAKKLLETTDRKLYQIAKAVGYENNKYFFRVFKKLEGITPEQYRKMQ